MPVLIRPKVLFLKLQASAIKSNRPKVTPKKEDNIAKLEKNTK
jgi:hypothetical protein